LARGGTLELRVLGAGDAEPLERFLVQHRDTSMFLRSNARHGGLVYRGQRLQAVYVGGFRGGELVGVAAHAWSGMLLMQAPEEAAALAEACIATSRRPISGLTGPADQVRIARRVLELEAVPASLEGDEDLYVLDLSGWQMPKAWSDGRVSCRPPLPSERKTLYAWRLGYELETLGRSDDAALRAQAASWMDGYIADGAVWVAVADGQPVSMSMFNARLPDIVQVGGVYTPPEARGQGYARAVVAHSMLLAQQNGAERGVLFTANPNAVRSYEAVGFERTGTYGLVLF
jgi:uncharacterized protein